MAIVRILGAGAIGLGVASQLTSDSITLEFICDENRKLRYDKDVFFVNNEPMRIHAVTPSTVTEPADLIIVALKYTHLEEGLELLSGSVGPDTIIVSLMNGIDSEAMIAKRWGIDKVIHAFIVEIDAVKEGNILYFTNPGVVILGDLSGEQTPCLERLTQLLSDTDICYKVSSNIQKDIWWKFMINVGVNQASAVLGAPYKVFQENKYAQDIMNDAMQEVIQLSQKLGIGLNQEDLRRWYKVLERLGPNKKTSMLQDIEAGRKTEVEMFAGTVCALGQKHDIATPANIMLYNMIKAYETMHGIDA